MEGVQAFILSMKRESHNQYIYRKSHKEYKKPTSTIKRFTLIIISVHSLSKFLSLLLLFTIQRNFKTEIDPTTLDLCTQPVAFSHLATEPQSIVQY